MIGEELRNFLANRPADGAAEAKAHVLDDATAAKLRSRAGTASSPDGKPKKPSRPWRSDAKWIEMVVDGIAKFTKAAVDAQLAPIKTAIKHNTEGAAEQIRLLKAEVAELRADLAAATKVRTFEEFDASGNLVSSTRESYIGGPS